jgi:hypothetical protein
MTHMQTFDQVYLTTEIVPNFLIFNPTNTIVQYIHVHRDPVKL